MLKGNAVAVLIVTPDGVPLIRDPKKPAPIFWKLPGGRGQVNESAKDCALREIKEEVGLVLPKDDIEILYSEDRGNHILTIFSVKLSTTPHIKITGDEGEEVKMFSPEEILGKNDFFPNHRKIIESILKNM